MTERDLFSSHDTALPPELAAALRDVAYACVTTRTDQGTAFVLKVPGAEIEHLYGRIPIQLRHELYAASTAPVIRIALTFYDDPLAPLAMETFINPADPAQRADYAALAHQETAALLFYDEQLCQQLRKRVGVGARAVVPLVLASAARLLAQLPTDRFDFEAAKRAVQEATPL